MKNKKNTYLLLVVVLVIWGLVGYMVFSYRNPEVPTAVSGSVNQLKPLDIKIRDTFTIDVDYRDPFLGKIYSPEKEKNNTVVIPKKIKDPIIWPQVIYKGIVSDNKDKKRVFMVSINGQTYFMNEKDTEAGITLQKGNRNTITVLYKGEKNEIVLQ